ncbi:MAG: tetratricopeptide repeat protein [Saprospiraceae bacterium]|nr:tetratricopeptide repeat protein [Saprospiraceae bacterium]
MRRAIYGKNHLATVDNLNWLVEVHFRKGQYDRALTYVDTALGILIPQVDDSNPEYAKSLYWKAILLGVKGNYSESEEAYRKLLDIRIKVLGKDDPETVSVMSNLGLLYWKVGRYAEAEEYWLETVRIYEKVLGPEHPKTVRAVGNMGIFYFDTGNMEKAEVFFLRNLKGLAETKGKDDPDYARALNNLSSFYQDQGDPEKAEPLVREGLEIIERKMGRNHPDFAIPLYNFGSLNFRLGRWDAARAAFRETEMIRRQTLGQHHYDLGLTLTALGRLERSQGNLVAADTCINEAIAILAESVGEGHPDYVSALIERVQLDMLQVDKEKVVAVFRDISRLDQEAIQRALFYLSDAEILNYIYRLQSHKNMLLVYASQTGNPELAGIAYDETLFLKGFLLYARQKMVKTALNNPDSKVIYDQLKEEYTQLAREMSKLQPDRDSLLVIQLTESTNQLEKDLARAVGKLGIEMGTVRWEDVQSLLKPEEVAIEFVTLQPLQGGPAEGTTYAALILKPGEALPQIKTLFQESQLADLLDVKTDRRSDYVNDLYAYADRGLAPTEKERKSLMELIWKPLMEEIDRGKTVYVSPAGIRIVSIWRQFRSPKMPCLRINSRWFFWEVPATW